MLHADGLSSKHGLGVGIRLTSPTEEILEQSLRLGFKASNNEAEYEALIAGMRLAQGLGIKRINAFYDSQLIANQFSGEYATKDNRMEAYLKVVKDLAIGFEEFTLTRIPHGENTSADALAALASTSNTELRRVIPVEFIKKPSITFPDMVNAISWSQTARQSKAQFDVERELGRVNDRKSHHNPDPNESIEPMEVDESSEQGSAVERALTEGEIFDETSDPTDSEKSYDATETEGM